MAVTNSGTYTKTRIAPTPSGFLHLGNVLSFAITAAIAEQKGARILLRIDDLDQNRVTPAYVQDIFDTLDYMGISWHEGPADYNDYLHHWSQLHRMELYHQALKNLRDRELLFACDCSRTQLAAAEGIYPGTCLHKNLSFEQTDANWRLRTDIPPSSLTVHTIKGDIQAEFPVNMQSFAVRKKDGYPAYQLSSVIDDLHFNVDLIVRGNDLWPSTLAQLYLAKMLPAPAFSRVVFHHHSLLMAGGEKLSKSAGSTAIRTLRKEGKKPAAIYELIGSMMGMKEPLRHYQQLPSALFT